MSIAGNKTQVDSISIKKLDNDGLQPSSINFWKNNALVEALRETTGDLRLRSELPYACPGELCITRLRRKRRDQQKALLIYEFLMMKDWAACRELVITG
uniref:Uncharacterized protein n=1 Tax=Schistosoma curassoni TaxID=6186 RepID=A0A183K5E2_9TREM